MQCKYYQILLGWTCKWSLWRGGRFVEVVFKTGSTVPKLTNYSQSQLTFNCSKLTIETLEKDMKYVNNMLTS